MEAVDAPPEMPGIVTVREEGREGGRKGIGEGGYVQVGNGRRLPIQSGHGGGTGFQGSEMGGGR
jgi:hypothetical protein